MPTANISQLFAVSDQNKLASFKVFLKFPLLLKKNLRAGIFNQWQQTMLILIWYAWGGVICSKFICLNLNCSTLLLKMSTAQQENCECLNKVNPFIWNVRQAYGQKLAMLFWILMRKRKRLRKRIINILLTIYRPNVT
jgi:hypothetical protein